MLFGEFEGFSLSDFDLYTENKQTLALFNSKRFLVAKKLEGIGEKFSGLLTDLFYDVSISSPSVWNHNKVADQVLYFIRKESEQKKLESFITKEVSITGYIEDPAIYHNHVMLGIKVNQNGLSVYLHLSNKAIIDYKNFLNKLDYQGLNSEFSEMIPKDAKIIDENGSEITLDILKSEKIANNESFTIKYCFDKSDEILQSSDLLEKIEEYLKNLKPIFTFIQWNSLNDYIQMNDVVKETVIKVKQAGLKAGDEVLIKDDFLFSGKRAIISKISKSGVASITVNGIHTKINASKLSKI